MKFRITYCILLVTVACTSNQNPPAKPGPKIAQVISTVTTAEGASTTSAPAVPTRMARSAPSIGTTTLAQEAKIRRAAADQILFRSEHLVGATAENAFLLQAELQQRKYRLLESQLDAAQARYLSDPNFEFVMEGTAAFADGYSSGVRSVSKAFIDAWVAARPHSPWAHYSEGLRWSDKAWTDRGDGWASTITDEQWSKVRGDEVHARKELREALRIDPKLMMAWFTLMNVDRVDPDSSFRDVTRDYRDSTVQLPGSLVLAEEYMIALEPRWGGSTEMMAEFATSKLSDLDKNPRFWGLQGDAAADEGCIDCVSGKWEDALKHYGAALAFEDRPSWLAKAGEAAIHLRRFGLAHEYYARAHRYKPASVAWATATTFLSELCDPTASLEQLKRDGVEAIYRQSIPDIDYLRQPRDCGTSAGELPWGDESIPDSGGLEAYTIRSKEKVLRTDKRATFPYDVAGLESPDSRYIVRSEGSFGKYTLQLDDAHTGHKRTLLSYSVNADAAWSPDSNRLAVTTDGPVTDCRIFKSGDSSAPVDIRREFEKHLSSFNSETAGMQSALSCPQWWDQNVVVVNVVVWSTRPQSKGTSEKSYRYDPEKNAIQAWPAFGQN